MANLSIFQHLLQPKSVADYDREAESSQLRQLQALQGQQQLAQVTRANQRADQLQTLAKSMPTDISDEGRMNMLRGGGYFNEADALDKSLQERAKTKAQAAKDTAEANAKTYDTADKRRMHVISGLQSFQNPADARQWLADSVVSGNLSMQDAQGMIKRVPADATEFGTWRDGMLKTLIKPEDQIKLTTPDANAVLQAKTSRENNQATADRIASEGAANRGVQMRGQDIASSDRKAAIKARQDTKGISPTLQKELIEQDDVVNSSNASIDALNKALNLNDKIYSGYKAVDRAKIRSNLPGDSAQAKATLDYDNLVGQQALSSLKSIFGGNPTEGERHILLELQASADKPADVRKDILNRAIQAAQRRMNNAKERSKAIRSGTYLSPEVDPLDDAMGIHGGQ